MRTLVVNLFGGPTLDKCLPMSGVFYKLRQAGYACHCLPESSLQARSHPPSLALSVAEQFERLLYLNGQADIVVTDTPLLHSLLVARPSYCTPNWCRHVWDLHMHFRNLNILLCRTKESFFRAGESPRALMECLARDQEITHLLEEAREPLDLVFADADCVEKITEMALRKALEAG